MKTAVVYTFLVIQAVGDLYQMNTSTKELRIKKEPNSSLPVRRRERRSSDPSHQVTVKREVASPEPKEVSITVIFYLPKNYTT